MWERGGPPDDAFAGLGEGTHRALVPLPLPWLTPALEKSQMFFRKWLEQAEAVGSFLLTQSWCLAPA